jgi:hypothetical protein
LLDLRRQLMDEYGKAPAAVMLIDRAVSVRCPSTRGSGALQSARRLRVSISQ